MKKSTFYNQKIISVLLIVFIISLTIISVAISQIIIKTHETQLVPSLNELQGTYTNWIRLIKEKGPEYTYALYKTENGKIKDYDKQHEYAHEMGSLLYLTQGKKGISICDDAYNSGCYHSFFGRAMSANGERILPSLYKECSKDKKNSGGCLHGIGHSLMYYLGKKKLPEALSTCSSILKNVPSFLCTSGVFMEYNVNTMNNSNGDKRFARQYAGDSFTPCNSINLEYQPACYFSLPQWWSIVLASPTEFEDYGKLCSKVTVDKNSKACFFGVGAIGVSAKHYEVVPTRSLCELMPNTNDTISCRAGAAHKLLSTGPSYAQYAYELCDDLNETDRQTCYGDVQLLSSSKL